MKTEDLLSGVIPVTSRHRVLAWASTETIERNQGVASSEIMQRRAWDVSAMVYLWKLFIGCTGG
jgi:hypothetical protein